MKTERTEEVGVTEVGATAEQTSLQKKQKRKKKKPRKNIRHLHTDCNDNKEEKRKNEDVKNEHWQKKPNSIEPYSLDNIVEIYSQIGNEGNITFDDNTGRSIDIQDDSHALLQEFSRGESNMVQGAIDNMW